MPPQNDLDGSTSRADETTRGLRSGIPDSRHRYCFDCDGPFVVELSVSYMLFLLWGAPGSEDFCVFSKNHFI